MKKICALLLAVLMTLCFSACDQIHPEHRDRYEYDTYLSALWGSSVSETAKAIGVSEELLIPQEDQTGRPEGSYSYIVNKRSSFMSRPTTVELIFGGELFGMPQELGLYAVLVICEEEPYEIPEDATDEERKYLMNLDYHLDGEAAIEDLDYRFLYNTVTESGTLTDERGSFSLYSWAAKTTLNDYAANEKLQQMFDAFTWTGLIDSETTCTEEEAKQAILDQPLSTVTLYYGNPDSYSHVIYNGLSAALLAHAE